MDIRSSEKIDSFKHQIAAAIDSSYLTEYYCEAGYIEQPLPILKFASQNQFSTVFDLASLSKALATAPLLFWTKEKNLLSFDDEVGFFLPELPEEYKKAKISELLSHTSGYPAWLNFWINLLPGSVVNEAPSKRQHIIEVLRRSYHRFLFEQGTCYSDVGYIVLGCILETIFSGTLDKTLYDYCSAKNFSLESELSYTPLKPDISAQTAPTGYCMIREKELRAEVHDENCAVLSGVSGHCGLFGTGEALASFIKNLWSEQNSYFSQDLSQQGGYSLGLRLGDDASSEVFGQGRSLGHLGFTGTAFWVDVPSKRYAIFLTNRVISGRISPEIKTLRRNFFSMCQKEFSRRR